MNTKFHALQKHCLLIGEDHFIVECAEILLSNKYNIIGIISFSKSTQQWARKNNIPLYKTIDDINLSNIKVDYLFSIVNSKIIPNSVLKRILKLSINYHHAPLPKYAGINAPSWAIINNEKQHGISWHVMSSEIDQGDILKQRIFALDEKETALSLNLKCYQHALHAFKELVNDLSVGYVSPISQPIEQRSYYGLSNKPKGNGWINWRDSAEEIEKHYRAFHFGTHDNYLSTLKFKIKTHTFIINELRLSDFESTSSPGTVVNLSNDCLEIATSTKNIMLTQIITLDGHDCNLSNLYKTHNLQKGSRLKSPSSRELYQFEMLSSEISKYEKFWVNQISQFNPVEFPFLTQKALDPLSINKINYKTVGSIALPTKWIADLKEKYSTQNEWTAIFIAALFIYLYKLGNVDKIGIGLIQSSYSNKNSLISSDLPFSIEMAENHSLKSIYTDIFEQLLTIKNKKTFINDIFYRYHDAKNSDQFPQISIVLDDYCPSAHNDSKSFIIFKISLVKDRCF